jgi:hypothetical protein
MWRMSTGLDNTDLNIQGVSPYVILFDVNILDLKLGLFCYITNGPSLCFPDQDLTMPYWLHTYKWIRPIFICIQASFRSIIFFSQRASLFLFTFQILFKLWIHEILSGTKNYPPHKVQMIRIRILDFLFIHNFETLKMQPMIVAIQNWE